MENSYCLQVNNLKKYFPVGRSFFGKPSSFLKAVDGVSFVIEKGRTLGLVGESGCGKSTVGRSILRLHELTAGRIIFNGTDITELKKRDMRSLRPRMQIIFQDPYSSLSPRMPIGEIIGEAVREHDIVPRKDRRAYIVEVMKSCGLPEYYYNRYPHEFSGGQRQRICIARALALKPEFIVCDEPVSALDVSVQAQIINLLTDLQQRHGFSYLFISHDLSVVKHISHRVAVMYLGCIVETGARERIFKNPLHPYTKALLSAIPIPDPNTRTKRIKLTGELPSPSDPPHGCRFCTRCSECMDICRSVPPVLTENKQGHSVACHLYAESI